MTTHPSRHGRNDDDRDGDDAPTDGRSLEQSWDPTTPSRNVDDGNGGEEHDDRGGAYEAIEAPSGPGKRLEDPIEARPYVLISPAREQVTPGNVISGLFGLYRAGSASPSRFNLKDRLGLKNYDKTFEFIIHKPRATKRFDFYLSVSPYDATAFKTLAANVAAMYPESFEFEIVPFNPVAAFASTDGAAQIGGRRIASLDGIGDLERLAGFEAPSVFDEHGIGSGNEPSAMEADKQLVANGVPLRPADVPAERRPSLVRWNGVSTKKNDWMTLLRPFSDTAVDTDDQYRSPLSVLLEQAVHTDDPFVFQAVFKPREDWTSEAEYHKRNLKMGNHGTLSAFKNEFLRQAFGTSEQERRNIHRGDISEQVGGSVTASHDNKIGGSRMVQIDHKQPTTTFDLCLRAACNDQTIQSISNAFTSLSGPYYGIEGDIAGHDDGEFARLCHARQASLSGLSSRFSKREPVICASPDELANFVVVPHTDALPRASRGSSGGSPDARSPLTATDEDLLSQYDHGMLIGYAETAVDNRPDIPIRLTAEQLTHHVLRAATTGGGKTTAMVNDALSAYDAFDGPIFVFDKKGGSMASEYKRAHFERFGNLDDVVHVPVPGSNDEVLAFPYFDIRPQLAAGVSRTVAVQEKVDRYNELLECVIGSELTQQAFVAQEILNNLIKALFDPVYGRDAWPIEDLFQAAFEMQEGTLPEVSDRTLRLSLTRHLHADAQRFQASIDAVMNRITKLAERSFIWRVLNFVAEWDDENGCYAHQSPMFDIQDILASKRVILIDTGDLRPASSNLFSFLLLDYIWSGARLQHRLGNTPNVSDGYVINLIIDEAAPMLQSALVREDMIPDGREFGLALEVIVHFAEQVKADALDVSAYKEILRNINTKLIGKLAIDDELVMTLFHEGIEDEELVDRITSLPRGEWVAQLPDTGFMTDIPELVTLLPVGIPDGHTDSQNPVTADTMSPYGDRFGEVDAKKTRQSRDDYCLLPASNSAPSADQLSIQHGRQLRGTEGMRERSAAPVDEPASRDESNHSVGRNPETQLGTGTSTRRSPTFQQGSDLGPDESRSDQAYNHDQGPSAPVDDLVDDFGSRHPPRTLPDSSSESVAQSTPGVDDGDGLREMVDEFLFSGVAHEPEDSPTSGGDSTRIGDDATGSGGDDERDTVPSSEGFAGSQEKTDSRIDESLTRDERQFLSAVVTTVNGQHPEFDLLDSMQRIASQFDDLDTEKLNDLGYLEEQTENLRVYYTVTRAGQRACGAKVATGENQGDINEKTYHKVMVEAFARTLEADPAEQLFVKRYTPVFGTDVKPDVVGFSGGIPVVLGEVVSNADHKLIVKHYDDFNRFDVDRNVWVVPNLSGAWNIVRALANAGRIDGVPAKRRGKTYRDLTRAVWGDDGEWEFVSAPNLLDELN